MAVADAYITLAVGCMLGAAAIAAGALGNEIILASFNGLVNTLTIAMLTYVTQITRRLDKEVSDGGR